MPSWSIYIYIYISDYGIDDISVETLLPFLLFFRVHNEQYVYVYICCDEYHTVNIFHRVGYLDNGCAQAGQFLSRVLNPVKATADWLRF